MDMSDRHPVSVGLDDRQETLREELQNMEERRFTFTLSEVHPYGLFYVCDLGQDVYGDTAVFLPVGLL